MLASIDYTVLNLGELQTNCYLIWCTKTQEALVIDPADSGGLISEKILELQLTLKGIVLTHGHFDHCLGLLELMLNFEVPVYLHPADLPLIKRAQQSAQHWLKHTVDPVPIPQNSLVAQQSIAFGESSLTVIETPGHTPGSVCLHYKPERSHKNTGDNSYSVPDILFSGDTLFKEGITRTDFRYSSVMQLHASLSKLKDFAPDTLVFSGHGEPARLEEALSFLQ